MDADMAAIEADLPQAVVIAGTSYACVAGGPTEGAELVEAGFDATATVLILVRQSLFAAGAVPYRNQAVTLTSGGKVKSLRVDTVTPSEDGVSYQLQCVDPRQ